MSDPGPYQSRLLNFLVPQYRRLKEKGDRAIRQVKVALSWTAQVVIYPVYLLLQTTRLAAHKLGQAVKAQLPHEEAPDVDGPIQELLLAVLPSEEGLVLTPDVLEPQSPKPNVPQHWDKIVNNGPLVSQSQQDIAYTLPKTAPPPADPRGGYKGQVIRGLATELTSKNMVLVTADNQELDIFTQQQQKEIQQLIIWQLAKYRRHQRQLAAGKRPPSWGKLVKSKTTLLPIRLLGQVMAWAQKGTVARTIDLFGESSLVHQPSKSLAPGEPEEIEFFSKLDSFIADLERGQISMIREGSTEIEGKIREWTEYQSHTESVTDGKYREKQHIFALIGAAIAYYFGSKSEDQELPAASSELEVKQLTGKGSEQSFSEGRSRLQAIKYRAKNLYDRQLLRLNKQDGDPSPTVYQKEPSQSEGNSESVTDGRDREKQNIFAPNVAAIAYLFGKKGGEENLAGSAEEKLQELTGSKKSGDARIGRERSITGAETAPKTGSEGEDWVTWIDVFGRPAEKDPKQAEAGGSGAVIADPVIHLVATTASGGQPDQQDPGDNINIELTPDWIETAATPSGYVKHPLEKILAWLDRGLLWLEERALGIWKWFAKQ